MAERNLVQKGVAGLSYAKHDNTPRLLATFGIVGPFSFGIGWLAAALLRPGPQTTPSELGVGPTATIINSGIILYSLLTIAFALGLNRGLSKGRGAKIASALVAVHGAAISGWAFFPARPETLALHGTSGVISLSAAVIAILVLSRTLKKDGRWRSYSSYSLVVGILALGTVTVVSLGAQPDPQTFAFIGPLAPWRGPLWFIVYVVVVAGWIEVMSIRLLRLTSTRLGQVEK